MDKIVVNIQTGEKVVVPLTEDEIATLPESNKPLPIPSVVSMRQARIALLHSNLLEIVENSIANGSKEDQITWNFATEVRREDNLVKSLSTNLGLTEQDLDNLFLTASSL